MYIFPIKKNRIIFSSYHGRQYSCNPKYIFEYMKKNYGNQYEYIWVSKDKQLFLKGFEYKDTSVIKYASLKYVFYVMTAGYIINNVQIEPFFPVRKAQVVVNTWHGGGAYKTGTIYSKTFKKRIKSLKTVWNIRVRMIKYVISSCKKFTHCIAKDFYFQENAFLPIGMPRNDIFFSENSFMRKKVFNYYKLDENEKMVLYAPTYRGDNKKPDNIDCSIEIGKLLKALSVRFIASFRFFYRSHYLFQHGKDNENYQTISASDYPDMQELLCAADVLITDYSSSIWDFSFTHKPCFLYVPDIEEYKSDRDFYTPIEEWPFPLARTNQELIENIKNFDSKEYISKINKHHKELGSYETGHATEQFCKLVFK